MRSILGHRPARFGAAASACLLAGSLLSACGSGGAALGYCDVVSGQPAPGSAAQLAGSTQHGTGGPITVGDAVHQPTSGPATDAAIPPTSTVTLLTGDRVRLDALPDGQETVSPIQPASGEGAVGPGFVRFAWGGDQFAVPYAAVPYLNSLLDPRLFDVSYLVRAGLDDAHRKALPVQVDADTRSSAEDLPAIAVAHRSASGFSASVAKDAAGQLGRLLARTARSGDAASLADVRRISLATPRRATLPAALPQQPAATTQGLHYRTLTLNFTGQDGQPATAIGWVQNVDDARLGTFFVVHADESLQQVGGEPGPVRFSVPDGTYSMQFTILSPHPGSYLGVDPALVVKPEVAVTADQTVTLDARAAKPYQVDIDPPVSSSLRMDVLSLTRASAGGGRCSGWPLPMDVVSLQGLGFAPSTLSATPTAAVSAGALGFDAVTGLLTTQPPIGSQSQPRYYLSFPDSGRIPASLTHTVRAADLTTVHEDVYASASGNAASSCYSVPDTAAQLWPTVYHAWGTSIGLTVSQEDASLQQPGEQLDYWYSSHPSLTLWQTNFNAPDCTRRTAAPRRITPGQVITEEWNKAPLAPARVAEPGSGTTTVCAACRQDDNGAVYLSRFGDSDASHYYYSGFNPRGGNTDAFRFYRDGQLAYATTGGEPFALDLPMLPTPATYRLDWTSTRAGDPDASIRTDWTFHSSRSDPRADLPQTEVCSPDTSRSCALLPLLFVRYDLAVNYQSQAQADAPFDITFTVAHQENAPAPVGLSASVSVSYDSGATWSDPEQATPEGENAFRVPITHPPLAQTDGFVALHVQVRDGAGNSVDQTITRAYALA